MKKIYILVAAAIFGASYPSFAQLGRLKGVMGKKDQEKTEPADSSKNTPSGNKGVSGLWSKAMTKVVKVAGSLGGSVSGMVATTNNLDQVDVQAFYTTNLHPSEVGVIAQTFLESWEPGGNSVALSFTSKNSIQFNKIDGTVLIDGKPANYASMGVYSASFKDNSKPKMVEINTSSGQKASFTLNPPKQSVKLLKINGQAGTINLDLSKDVVLELQEDPADQKTPVLVWLTGNTIGLKTFYEVGWFAPASKITVPAAMFRNMNGVSNNLNFTNAYLQVSRSRIEPAGNVSGTFQQIEFSNMVTDGKFVNITVKPAFNKGLSVEGEEKYAAGTVNYHVKKPNALFSPDLARIKDLGVISFAIQGTTSFYDKKENKLTNIETTKTAKFPQFENSVWDNILQKMYEQVTAILKAELNANILPIEKITTSAGYKTISPWSKKDQNTEDNFSRAYKDTKLLLGLRPISEMGGAKSGENKVMKETGANALLKFTINLDINFEGSKAFMTPKMVFDINGPLVGGVYNTSYLNGVIEGKGIPYKGNITPEILEKLIIREGDLLSVFRKSLQEMKAKEQGSGDYKTEWDAMPQQF